MKNINPLKPGYIPFPVLYKTLGRSSETALRKVRTALKNDVIRDGIDFIVREKLSYIHIGAAKLIFKDEYDSADFPQYENEYLIEQVKTQGSVIGFKLQYELESYIGLYSTYLVDAFIDCLVSNDFISFIDIYTTITKQTGELNIHELEHIHLTNNSLEIGRHFVMGLSIGCIYSKIETALK